MKCLKVVKNEDGKLVSCVLSNCRSVKKFAKEYGTDILTDHSMVFSNNVNHALGFMDLLSWWGPDNKYELWAADAAVLTTCHKTTRLNSACMGKFLKGKPLGPMNLFEPPIGTMLGFDVRLIRRVR